MSIQNERLENMMEMQNQRIMSVLLSGAHERVLDADLQRLWKEMGWKGSVKARHFVLALRDYFTDQFNVSAGLSNPGLPTPPPDSAPHSNSHGEAHNYTGADDRWTLEHINVAHLQPIVEIIDDDGTGFISIKEANTFALERPPGWTLLHWLAFWARGWHHNISHYQNQIYLLIQDMHRNLDRVKPGNRYLIDLYLNSNAFRTFEQLLRSTKLRDENDKMDSKLSQLTSSYMKIEEERLEKSLKSVSYNLDSPATIFLISGQGRIERYVYPLLYLVLRHHARIIKIASQHILYLEEMDHWVISLESLVTVIKRRAENLEAVYKQAYVDVRTRLDNFAFGMYRLIWEEPDSWKPGDNTLASWQDKSTERDEDGAIDYHEEDLKFLHYPPENTFSYEFPINSDIRALQISSESPNYPAGVEGIWSGYIHEIYPDGEKINIKGLVMFWIHTLDNGKITGKYILCDGKGDISGHVDSNGGKTKVFISFQEEEDFEVFYHLSGVWCPSTQRIEGTCTVEGDDEEVENDGENEGDGQNEEESDEESDVERETNEEEHDGAPVGKPAEVDNASESSGGEEGCEKENVGEENIDDTAGSTTSQESTITFLFRRTPPELYRFRYSEEEYTKQAARARWAFACKAVLYLVQKERWTWPYLRDRINECKRSVDLRLRIWHEEAEMAPDRPLNSDEERELDILDESVSPNFLSLCEALADYEFDREPYLFNAPCTNCKRLVTPPGFICLQCLNPDLSGGIRLCLDCVDKPTSFNQFVHDSNHSVLKTCCVIHDYRFSSLVHNARTLVTRNKPALREATSGTKPRSGKKKKSKVNKYRCACCDKPISSTPCYVCAECPGDTFICKSCDALAAGPLPDGAAPQHKPSHVTIRLSDICEERFEQDATDAVTKRLESLEKTLQSHVVALEERLNKLMNELVSLEQLIANVAETKETPT